MYARTPTLVLKSTFRRYKLLFMFIATIAFLFVMVQIIDQFNFSSWREVYMKQSHKGKFDSATLNEQEFEKRPEEIHDNSFVKTRNEKKQQDDVLDESPNEMTEISSREINKDGVQDKAKLQKGLDNTGTASSLGIDKETTHRGSKLEDIRMGGMNPSGIQTYQNITFAPPNCRKKLLVYICYPRLSCGGLADRQKGIISTFILAMLTNRTFVIDTIVPCNIEHVLPPHLYDWMKCRSTIKDRVNDTRTINNFVTIQDNTEVILFNGSDLWTESVVKIRVNNRIYNVMKTQKAVKRSLPWLISKPEEDVIKHTMELLFKHSANVSKTLHMFKRAHFQNRYRVCLHMRVGGKAMINDPTFLNTGQILNMFEFLTSYVASLQKPYAMYVASDSSAAKRMAKKSFPNALTFNTTVKHLDYTRDTSCDPTWLSVLEQAILSQCDTILTTGSGFSRLAVLIGGKAQHIFLMYERGNHTKAVNNYTLHSLAESFGNG